MQTRHTQAQFYVAGHDIALRWGEVDTLFESEEGLIHASLHLRRSVADRRLFYTLFLHLFSSDPFCEYGIEFVETDLEKVPEFISSAYFDFVQKIKVRKAKVVGNLLRDLARQWTAFLPTLLEEEKEFRTLEQRHSGQ